MRTSVTEAQRLLNANAILPTLVAPGKPLAGATPNGTQGEGEGAEQAFATLLSDIVGALTGSPKGQQAPTTDTSGQSDLDAALAELARLLDGKTDPETLDALLAGDLLPGDTSIERSAGIDLGGQLGDLMGTLKDRLLEALGQIGEQLAGGGTPDAEMLAGLGDIITDMADFLGLDLPEGDLAAQLEALQAQLDAIGGSEASASAAAADLPPVARLARTISEVIGSILSAMEGGTEADAPIADTMLTAPTDGEGETDGSERAAIARPSALDPVEAVDLDPAPATRTDTADTKPPTTTATEPTLDLAPSTDGDDLRLALTALNARSDSAAAPRPVAAGYQTSQQQINLPQIAFEMVRQVQQGQSQFQIRLDPPELGRIDVRMDIDQSGAVTARLTVERAETLDLMQRDQRTLERALAQAGLDSSKTTLEFSLRQNTSGGQNQQNEGGTGNGPFAGLAEGEDTVASPPAITLYRGRLSATGIDLTV
jgi:flagellar hook-length control protein FliK